MGKSLHWAIELIFALCPTVLDGALVYLNCNPPDNAAKYIRESVVPNAILFGLEGLMFVTALTVFEMLSERQELSTLKEAVISALSFFEQVMANVLRQSELAEAPGIDCCSAEALSKTMWELEAAVQQGGPSESRYSDAFTAIAADVSDAVRLKAAVHLKRLTPLSPVAARFGGAFLKQWLEVTDCLFAMIRKQGFAASTAAAFGKYMDHSCTYGQFRVLFGWLAKLNVPAYSSHT